MTPAHIHEQKGGAMKNAVELPNGCRLTDREIEILQWVAVGKTNVDIAMIHNRSMNTVKNQLHQIFSKLDVVTRAQAVVEAMQLGVMKLNDPAI